MSRPWRELDPHSVWRAAVSINLFTMIAVAAGMITMPEPASSPLTIARLAQLAWAATLTAVALQHRGQPRPEIDILLYGLAALPLMALFPAGAFVRELNGTRWEPFFREKLVCLAFALASPGELPLTLAIIVATTALASAEFWIGGLRTSVSMGMGEPWVTMGVGVAGACMLAVRVRLIERARRAEEALREAAELARVARVALAVRELANTPLQAIEVVMYLLEVEPARARRLLPRLHRALGRLRELDEVLRGFEAHVHWERPLEALDATSVLRDRGRS